MTVVLDQEPRTLKAERADRVRSPSLSCVVPCWNDAEALDRLMPSLIDVLESSGSEWEIVVVDDGSTDAIAETLQRWLQLPEVKALQLSRNFGKEAALTAGLRAARGAVVVMLDADLQHSPSLIPAMIEQWRRGADMVYALRANRDDEPLIKRWGTNLFYKIINQMARVEIPAGAGDFRLMDRAVVDALLALPERNRFMKGLYAWVGFHAVALPYEPARRVCGNTRFNKLRLLRMSLDGITAFTNWPLRLVSVMGFLLAIVGFAYGGYLCMEYFLYGHDVSGWTTIVVSLMLFMGVQLISIGVLGEYISRIFEEVKGRPLYIVKRELGRGLSALEK